MIFSFGRNQDNVFTKNSYRFVFIAKGNVQRGFLKKLTFFEMYSNLI